MTTIIEKNDGKRYILNDLNIFTRDFVVSSPSYKHTAEEMEGGHGAIDLGTTYGVRTIRGIFYFKAVDHADYVLFRDEVFNLFNSNQSFYLIDNRNGGKRWLVKCASSFEPDQLRMYGFFEVEFVSFSPFAESIGTTLDPLSIDSSIWQVGQGLTTEDLGYVHTTPSFRIYNAGVIPIDPRRMPLLITFKGASTNLKIRNKTTGDEWSYTGTTTANDTIRLDRVRSTKNSLSIFRDTNRKLISIESGWNDFEITGATSPFSISFDFRFYYL
ncbi:phage tail family protein [Bacillus wiedmannii]|uniref:phage tail family protein n=1 Tax=Bacillus wiedmannii TaxID=1890302 RepID=UPI000BF7FEAF|nr:phage tail family protein [Bacillus wiedmannii]PGC72628.1 phage tail protein [Bacillus wiedmannii]